MFSFTLNIMMAIFCNLRLLSICSFASLNSLLLMNYSCHKRLLSVLSLELFQANAHLMLYKSAKQYHNRLGVVI